MHEYEIRILRADRTTATVIEVMHLSDNSAIRVAKKMAEDQPFEVWRDLDCIYRAQCHSAQLPPSSGAAA